jgi:NAD(P)-dependent dehydrogenase (short-subunit alcohol dehydrogenase family)
MSNRVLITGANRGIGLALVREYLSRGDEVFAGCRRPDEATELRALVKSSGENLHVLRLDVTRDESTAAAAQFVWSRTESLDVLVNNAGINPEEHAGVKLTELELQDVRNALEVNVIGTARVTRAMLPLLEKGHKARIVNITSGVGCISEKAHPGYYAYGLSKAALNYFTRGLAAELKERGVTTVLVSPGWVKTDMGGPDAKITPEQSAAGIASLVEKLTSEDNSLWFNWDGQKNETW